MKDLKAKVRRLEEDNEIMRRTECVHTTGSTPAPTGPSAMSSTPLPAGATGTTTGDCRHPWDDDPGRVPAGPLRGPQPRAATRVGAAEDPRRFRLPPTSGGLRQRPGPRP